MKKYRPATFATPTLQQQQRATQMVSMYAKTRPELLVNEIANNAALVERLKDQLEAVIADLWHAYNDLTNQPTEGDNQ